MTLSQKSVGFGKPPLGNTGVKLTKYPFVHTQDEKLESKELQTSDAPLKYEGVGCEFGIDWFDASVLIPIYQADAFIKYFVSYLNDELTLIGSVKMRGSCEVFNKTYNTTRGSRVYLADDDAAMTKYNGHAKIYISICGENLRAIGLERKFRFLIALNCNKFDLKFPSKSRKYQSTLVFGEDRKWKCNRIDIGCSDFGKKLPMQKIIEAIQNDNFAGFKKARQTHNFKTFGTIYAGQRGSGAIERFYDESEKTCGVRDSLRSEREFRDMCAQVVYKQILELVENRDRDFELIQDAAYQFLKELTFGGFDFVDRFAKGENKETHLDRCERLDWWQEYLDYVEATGIKLPMPSYKKTIEAKIEWIVKQVSPTLALLKKAYKAGEFIPWLLEAIRQADDRITDSAASLLRVWKDEIQSTSSSTIPAYGELF